MKPELTVSESVHLDLRALAVRLPKVSKRMSDGRFDTRLAYLSALGACGPALTHHGIDTPERLAHFIGQGLVETGWLCFRTENLRYSAERLVQVFSHYRKNPQMADAHAGDEIKIANAVYGDRRDLGNHLPGDGYRFRGRGFIQLTGRGNYERHAALSGLPIDRDPDLLSRDLGASLRVAAVFWRANGLNVHADQDDAARVSRAINRGNAHHPRPAHGEKARSDWTRVVAGIVSGREGVRRPAGQVLKAGQSGKAVARLQLRLGALGFDAGPIDGRFGTLTRRAVEAFQHEARLQADGQVGEATRRALAGYG